MTPIRPARSQAGYGQTHAGKHEEHDQQGRCKLVQLLKQMFVAAGIDISRAGGHAGQKGRHVHGGAYTGHAHDGDTGQHKAVVLAAPFVDEPAEHDSGYRANGKGGHIEQHRQCNL